jgi:hypothetical protein
MCSRLALLMGEGTSSQTTSSSPQTMATAAPAVHTLYHRLAYLILTLVLPNEYNTVVFLIHKLSITEQSNEYNTVVFLIHTSANAIPRHRTKSGPTSAHSLVHTNKQTHKHIEIKSNSREYI